MNIKIQTTQEVSISDAEANRITVETLYRGLAKGIDQYYDYIDIHYSGKEDDGMLCFIRMTESGPKGTDVRKATELDKAIMTVLQSKEW